MIVTVAVEGETDAAVSARLLDFAGHSIGPVYGRRGKAQLDTRLSGFNSAARLQPWFVLRDLDHDAPCAPELVIRLLPSPSRHMTLRIAVRAIEAWLMADEQRFAAFLGISAGTIPTDPDREGDPKATVVSLARKSRHRKIREDIVPLQGYRTRVGPAYSARLSQYVFEDWRPMVARRRSPSLDSCIEALKRL